MYTGFINLYNRFIDFIPAIPGILVTIILGYIIIAVLLSIFVRVMGLAKVHKALVAILRSLLSVILWIVLVSHILRNLGLSQIAATLSGSLLVIGLAIATGAQALVADIISGLFLAKDPDFDIGHLVKIGDTEGIIESIDIRKTRIRTREGTLTVLPNALIDKERWVVMAKPERKTMLTQVRNKLKARRGINNG